MWAILFSQPDLIIAASALHHGLTVVTRNRKDFDKAGVPVFNPWDSYVGLRRSQLLLSVGVLVPVPVFGLSGPVGVEIAEFQEFEGLAGWLRVVKPQAA